MIAISSAKPHTGNPEYATNQRRACESWSVFRQVFYFSPYEPDLAKPNVLTVKSEPWPTIKAMTEFCTHMTDDLVAIINADIVVTPEIHAVEKKLKELTIPASTSYRYEFLPEDFPDLTRAVRHKEDRGMDIFVATPDIWKMVAKRVPDYLRIGNQRWDSWMCGFCCANFGFGFRQFTDYRCVFHPRHEGRVKSEYSEVIAKEVDEYFTRAHVPSPL